MGEEDAERLVFPSPLRGRTLTDCLSLSSGLPGDACSIPRRCGVSDFGARLICRLCWARLIFYSACAMPLPSVRLCGACLICSVELSACSISSEGCEGDGISGWGSSTVELSGCDIHKCANAAAFFQKVSRMPPVAQGSAPRSPLQPRINLRPNTEPLGTVASGGILRTATLGPLSDPWATVATLGHCSNL